MDKHERAALAKKHVENMERRASSAIHFSQVNTLIYGGPNKTPAINNNKNNTKMQTTLKDCDTVTALFHATKQFKNNVALLNFASYKNPGGGYLKGALAQEEALCAESTLYPVLAKFTDSYYDWNREHLNRALYTNRALYSPSIIFSRDEKEVPANVITCAAPNYTGARRQKISWEDNLKVLKDRIKFVLDVAEENSVNTLILGAWGCGVFSQSPKKVAEYFLTELTGRSFSKVIFTVPKSNRNANYTWFKEVIDDFNK